MPKKRYRVAAVVTVSIFTDVVATSKEQALDLAAERQMQDFCHQCSTSDSAEVWSLSGELDGDACELRIEDG
jgi:hypothetical protein